MSKYEKLIEYIINDEEDKARQLFHDIVVEKSREIYESLMDEEMHSIGGNPVESLVDEVTGDEEGMQEADEMAMDADMDDMDADMDDMEVDMDDMDADMPGDMDDMDAGAGEIEDRVMDLEDALDELKAEFDALMADDADQDDMDAEEDEEADEEDVEDSEEEEADEEELQEAKSKKDDKKKLMDADKKHMSEAARLREYTEKLGDIYKQDPAKGEGHEVGKGGSVSVDKKSIVAGKNDMGGSTANIAKGGSEQDPDNKPIPEPKNEYSKGKTQVKHAGEWKNKVGGSTGSFKQKAPAAKTGEEGNTNDRSPLAK